MFRLSPSNHPFRWLSALLGLVLVAPCHQAVAQLPSKDPEASQAGTEHPVRKECRKFKSSVEYDEVCGHGKSWESEACCRDNVSILSDHRAWVDGKLVAEGGQLPLSVGDLENFYGLNDENKFDLARKEANRKVILALMAAWCVGRGVQLEEMTEAEILESCTDFIPGLAALGLSTDHGGGSIEINSDWELGKGLPGSDNRYDGSSFREPFRDPYRR